MSHYSHFCQSPDIWCLSLWPVAANVSTFKPMQFITVSQTKCLWHQPKTALIIFFYLLHCFKTVLSHIYVSFSIYILAFYTFYYSKMLFYFSLIINNFYLFGFCVLLYFLEVFLNITFEPSIPPIMFLILKSSILSDCSWF